ncbi:MAG TPA: carbohydrate ABC transporter permease [Chloroflexota bacterium]|jgi:multiple sugar transport system permease protein|nr:carbohydrate ABC transporter permease [Chloroflexota bacterium]
MSTESPPVPPPRVVVSYRARRIAGRTATYLLLIAGAVILMTPFVYMIGTAFKPNVDTLSIPPSFIPNDPTLSNFTTALTTNGFGRAFLNSAIVSVASTAICVLLSAMLAFAFARYSFPGRTIFYYFILLTFMLPPLVLIIPQYVLAGHLHLLNSLQGLIVVYSANIALNVFLLRGFFEDIPQDLQDAGEIDGASILRQFWNIMLPLARPAIATVTIFTFLANWTEFAYALTFINDPSLYTLSVNLSYYQQQNVTEYSPMFAASLIATVPMIVIFILLQRHFIKGIASGAIKA